MGAAVPTIDTAARTATVQRPGVTTVGVEDRWIVPHTVTPDGPADPARSERPDISSGDALTQ